MNALFRKMSGHCLVGILLTVGLCFATAAAAFGGEYAGAVLIAVLLALSMAWQIRMYRRHTREVLFMLDALENNDNSFRFDETSGTGESRAVHEALNRVAQILYRVKTETAEQEKYYELILDFVDTGVLVLNDNGAVYRKNREAMRLLGLTVFTHVRQLRNTDSLLAEQLEACRAGDRMQATLHNERGTVNLVIRVSDITVRGEHLRILALSDINTELDEKEAESWIRLTRVLTHEIMNSITPLTSISDTLLSAPEGKDAETIRGLQAISATGKGLLAFTDSYRRLTRIPPPEPVLFDVKTFIERMIALARHQYPCGHIRFETEICPEELILYADENLVSQVVVNILKNAIQAIGDRADGRIDIKASCNDKEEVWIEVGNNGPAIPPEAAEHIFVPFFTTKEGGSGVGLSVSRRIMRLSGGNLVLLPGKETRFRMNFK
ncbi:sensor histidine kinase [Bacteroides pyogenes]|uniref:sensor histidine kinase n=1 Tax=Bacteroides pyogenes TaxID=310300 RepID=UPI003F98EB30